VLPDIACLMLSLSKIGALLLVVVVFLVIFSGFAEATTASLTVKGGETVTSQISLAVDDHVLIEFTVVGDPDSTVVFSLLFPNGTVMDFGQVGVLSNSFTSNAEGNLTLRFDNTDSTNSKLVTLNYEVEHYFFGMPQMMFLTIVVILVCVAMVAGYIILSRPSY
jgi:hypothetical protein